MKTALPICVRSIQNLFVRNPEPTRSEGSRASAAPDHRIARSPDRQITGWSLICYGSLFRTETSTNSSPSSRKCIDSFSVHAKLGAGQERPKAADTHRWPLNLGVALCALRLAAYCARLNRKVAWVGTNLLKGRILPITHLFSRSNFVVTS